MKTKLQIEGMSCEHCVKALTQSLTAVAGVRSADVRLKTKSAEVEHDESVTLDALKAAVADAGFETR